MHKKTAIWVAGRNGSAFLERCNTEIAHFGLMFIIIVSTK